MRRVGRRPHNAKRGKKPAAVQARQRLVDALGHAYALRPSFAHDKDGRLVRTRWEVLKHEHDDAGFTRSTVIATGPTPNATVTKAIAEVAR